LRGVDAHNAGLEAQNRALEAQNRALEAPNRAMEAQNGVMEGLLVVNDSHHFDEEQDMDPGKYGIRITVKS
jgi:hypothetical protein